MVELSRESLERPVEETARRLALGLLEEAAAAAHRLRSGEDPEALHDFRVGLRRLRSSMRAYRPYLKGSVSKKLRRKLKSVATATSPARDTEVQLAWLGSQAKGLRGQHAIGLTWLIEHLKRRGEAESASSLPEVLQRFDAIAQELGEELRFCTFRLGGPGEEPRASFLSATGRLILEQAATLQRDLASIQGVDDDEAIHRARITGKRVRYLLEPLRKAIRAAKPLVREMKELQDILGELHDTKLLEAEIVSALETSAVQRARRLQQTLRQVSAEAFSASDDTWEERHGLLEVSRRLGVRARGLFERAQSRFLGEQGGLFVRPIDALGRHLCRANGSLPDCRRFLLSRLPNVCRHASYRSVELGWLPDNPARERLRRERGGRGISGVSYYRRLHGSEEPISRRLFTALWPLTGKRRLRKRRYTLTEGGASWRLSHLPDIGIVLAELDSPAPGAELKLPPWLEPLLVKEVTGDSRYEDRSLARRRRRRTQLAARRKKRGN